MNTHITAYNRAQEKSAKLLCAQLATQIDTNLPTAESKIWHRSPVWFIEGNPVVGYTVRNNGVQLLFWSGQSFDEPELKPEGKFKAASFLYTDEKQINAKNLKRWLKKALNIQWDYKDIVKRKGKLVRLNISANKGSQKPSHNTDIDTYIKSFPQTTQSLLQTLRTLIKKVAPQAEEAFSYRMPTFKLFGKNFVHFAGYQHHIGFYPTPDGIAAFKKELAQYASAKGSVRFPLDKPLPINLIKKIITFRLKEMEKLFK